MLINKISGNEGRVEVTGLRAVVGIFIKWSLERRGMSQSGAPAWTFRAALSYQKDSLLLNKRLTKKIFVKYRADKMYELVLEPDAEISIEGTNMRIEGVTLCPVELPK